MRAEGRLSRLSAKLHQFRSDVALSLASRKIDRDKYTVLIFFHGHSLAHTMRPLVVARQLCKRGYPVKLAGVGRHRALLEREGFAVLDVETIPQERIDASVSQGNYRYYDRKWIDACIESETEVVATTSPSLVIHDFKPTVEITCQIMGIDEAQIIQAYGVPDYPFPIRYLDHLFSNADDFSNYLAETSISLKPIKQMRLVADTPELHPLRREVPGYYYVGPLVDVPEEPSGWELCENFGDTSRPLIYLTCGSSGLFPEYLEELIRRIECSPYRMLVTTAGRWAGEVTSNNVRVVDFVPGKWVLKRAHALVGVVGAGAIYQALGEGVPIIGAPEHLDQEYHMNRVKSLGLGLKIERDRFDADHLLQALDRLREHYRQIRGRCTSFSESVNDWISKDVVADLVDSFFLAQQKITTGKNYAFCDRRYAMSESEFVHYLYQTTPESLSYGHIEHILRDGIKKGLPHWKLKGIFYFDWFDSWNWLYRKSPAFFEADYWAAEAKRDTFFIKIGGGRIKMRRPKQRFRLEYRYRLISHQASLGMNAQVFLPYPIETKNQKNIELVACCPVDLEQYLLPQFGFFYGYPMQETAVDPVWEFGYTCELTVLEQRADTEVRLVAAEKEKWLSWDPMLLNMEEVQRVRWEVCNHAGNSDEQKARFIYRYLCQNKYFKKTKDPVRTLYYSTHAVLRDTGGHCITLTQAFMALCRMEGIPAREVTGALLGYPMGEGVFRQRTYKEGIFGHTWAEIYLQSKGWIPVEFHGVVIGKIALSGENTVDANIQRRIMENSDQYLDYYFGNLDTHRIISSHSVKEIPHCLPVESQVQNGHSGWDVELPYECELTVRCL